MLNTVTIKQFRPPLGGSRPEIIISDTDMAPYQDSWPQWDRKEAGRSLSQIAQGAESKVRKNRLQSKSWPLGSRGIQANSRVLPTFPPIHSTSLLEHFFSTLFLGCEAGDGPDFDLNAIVELFPPHVPDTLIGCGNGPVLGIGRGGAQVSFNRARWVGEQKPLAITTQPPPISPRDVVWPWPCSPGRHTARWAPAALVPSPPSCHPSPWSQIPGCTDLGCSWHSSSARQKKGISGEQ